MLFPPKDNWLKALARPVRIVKKKTRDEPAAKGIRLT
jgi:hypothetical protein